MINNIKISTVYFYAKKQVAKQYTEYGKVCVKTKLFVCMHIYIYAPKKSVRIHTSLLMVGLLLRRMIGGDFHFLFYILTYCFNLCNKHIYLCNLKF